MCIRAAMASKKGVRGTRDVHSELRNPSIALNISVERAPLDEAET
jgi:hypothetical protein